MIIKRILIMITIMSMVLVVMGKPEAQQPTIKKVAKNAWVITGNYFNEHMTVVDTSIGLVVVDTLTTAAATRRAMKLLRKFNNKPVKYVINTHFDVDHYAGNQLFHKATIIGHINCQKHYDSQFFNKKSNVEDIKKLIGSMGAIVPGNDPVSTSKREAYISWYTNMLEGFADFKFTPPNLFVKESKTIYSGNTKIELIYLGPGHTDADLLVLFPKEKILVTGDLVLGEKSVPVIHRIHGGNILNMVSILDQIKKIAKINSTLIPGHGTYTGIEVINDQKEYLKQLLNLVKRAQKKGVNLLTARKEIKMERYKNHWLYEMIHQGNVETAWYELKNQERAE